MGTPSAKEAAATDAAVSLLFEILCPEHRELGLLLIGSRANGTATPASDLDVVVVTRWRQLPRLVLSVLPAAAERVADLAELPVSLSPLPHSRLRGQVRSIYQWKLRNEATVLFWPGGWPPLRPSSPPDSDLARESYAMSAAIYLLAAVDPSDLVSGRPLNTAVARGLVKARQHTCHLEAFKTGHSDARSTRLPVDAEPSLGTDPADWCSARDALLGWLAQRPLQRKIHARYLVNLRYAAYSAVQRRRRWAALRSIRSIETRLAAAAVALLRAVQPGRVDDRWVKVAAAALPSWLLPRGPLHWGTLRDVVVEEWSHAHLLGVQ